MNRRELLLGAAALAATASSSRVFASNHEHDHAHMHAMAGKHDKLIAAAADCVVKANLCLQHCIVLLGQGDKDMAACARTSSQAAAICTALQQLAASDARQLPKLAKVAMDICKECEEECKKSEKHPECKACMEACIACYNECKAIAA